MDFIFMLTRDDQTVQDCLRLLDSVADLQLSHLGFKDVGVDRATLLRLHRAIKAAGATSYLEVVSTSRERALDSARLAMDLGVDWLMGGTWVDETLALLSGTGIRYLPFPGIPTGHPTRLGGTPVLVAEQCRRFEEAGCAGVDLLAYRASESSPIELVRSARQATSGHLVVAGSIASTDQIRRLASAGVDAFTVGSAAMTGTFAPHRGTLHGQLAAIIAAANGDDGGRGTSSPHAKNRH
ncbi:HisA/HisF-related TIM barrel protein [Streptosporangium sp. NPDC000396]|uniref:HisA/HisF-related TIM barrel protein n=1 Tax=Streptosporangium sp. NPDC000396 TaxID=3366185 RepID=UPI00368A26DA